MEFSIGIKKKRTHKSIVFWILILIKFLLLFFKEKSNK